MGHVIEPATSGRAKCRGCGGAIANGTLRLGERLPNPFGDGEMTLWFHPTCGAFKRPAPFLEALDAFGGVLPDEEALRRAAAAGVEHRRLPRIDGAERAPSGRARCRACRELIAKGSWRIRLVYFEEGRFEPSGSIHTACAAPYFETAAVEAPLRHFSPALTESHWAEVVEALGGD